MKLPIVFNCVPSQINYVINTRFTVQQGYVVESKRGGGGYIRIMKVNLVDDMDIIDALLEVVPEELSIKQANHILQNLYDNELLSKREAQLLKYCNVERIVNRSRANVVITS